MAETEPRPSYTCACGKVLARASAAHVAAHLESEEHGNRMWRQALESSARQKRKRK